MSPEGPAGSVGSVPAAPVRQAVLALGSNLGDRLGHLREAVARLGDRVLVASGAYETPPWPAGQGGPAYLNAVVLGYDEAAGPSPYHWLDLARDLERAAGRVREPGQRYAPRTLDVDVITAWDAGGTPVTCDDPALHLPHPRAHQRAFVLQPWADIQPYAELPGHGPVLDLLRSDAVARERRDIRLICSSLEP